MEVALRAFYLVRLQLMLHVSQLPDSVINEILRIDENGRTLAAFPNVDALAPLFLDPAGDSHCLQYIDLYGDTIFNGAQTLRLSEEVAERASRLAPMAQHHARELRAFLDVGAAEPHTYVKFVGD
jgi:hypothetical protein